MDTRGDVNSHLFERIHDCLGLAVAQIYIKMYLSPKITQFRNSKVVMIRNVQEIRGIFLSGHRLAGIKNRHQKPSRIPGIYREPSLLASMPIFHCRTNYGYSHQLLNIKLTDLINVVRIPTEKDVVTRVQMQSI